jgi:hypothetical protein
MRHDVSGCEEVFEKIDKALSTFAEMAATN